MLFFIFSENDFAGVAQLVEHQLPKLEVASSNLVARSLEFVGFTDDYRV